MKLSPYGGYKAARTEWIGSIPSHWEEWKVSHGFLRIGSGTTPKSDNGLYYDGDTLWVTTAELRESVIFDTATKVTDEALQEHSALRIYPIGSVLIAMYGATIGRLGMLGHEATVNQACCVFSRPEKFDSRFFYFWLWMRRPILISLSSGGGQPNLNQEELKRLRVPIPSIPEQQQIAAFLDWKTGQIDALIARKQELLERLKEKRLAVISQVVTRGLNPAAPLRDSGIPWLGQVPHHWQVRSLKFCFDFLNNRRIPLSSEERASMARDFPYYGASGIIDYVDGYIFDERLILIGEDGANLLSRSTPLAFEARGKYWVNNHAHILRPTLGPFTYWSNLLCIVQYAPWITGAAQPKLTKENLGSVPLPCPPRDEQNAIAEFIEAETGKIDPLINLALETVARLAEYRAALITAATTGKIDVRNVRIPQPVA